MGKRKPGNADTEGGGGKRKRAGYFSAVGVDISVLPQMPARVSMWRCVTLNVACAEHQGFHPEVSRLPSLVLGRQRAAGCQGGH